MASGKQIPCGPCSVDDVIKNAWRWCTSCEEGLCEDCEHVHRRSKSSKNHQVISIEDYSKIENIFISQVCELHRENLEWFCKSHDEVLCVVCVPSKHKSCYDIIPISAISANSRQSSALSDIEETIDGTLRNVKQCIKNRESATKELEKQELGVKTMVLETRTKINRQLDRLQENLLQEIKSIAHPCKSKYMKILKKLKSTEEMLTKLREQTIHMKQFSSDIQVFLRTRQVNKRIVNEVESIKSELGAAKDYELKVYIDSLIEKLANEVEEFGVIKVSECVAKLDFRDPKLDQAQIKINLPTTRNISDIKLHLIRTFVMKKRNEIDITGCIILPNGRLVMTNNTKENHLIEYSDTGEHIRDIQVSYRPHSIAVIDRDRIVVTYGDTKCIEILNSNTFNVENKISLKKSCLGVSHDEGQLYVVYGNSIQVLDLSGNQLGSLKCASTNLTGISKCRDKIFYADYKSSKIHCCHLNGEEIWQFESDNIQFPDGVTVDNYHNIYVLGYISGTLTIIQNDGKNSEILLSNSDGLLSPQAIYYDKDKRTLLICNKKGKVAMYKII